MRYLIVLILLLGAVVKAEDTAESLLREFDSALVKPDLEYKMTGTDVCQIESDCPVGAECMNYAKNYRPGHCFCYLKAGCFERK